MRRFNAIGDLRHRLTLEDQSQTVSGSGAITTTWTFVATIWGRMEPASTRVQLIAGRDESWFDWIATVRYRPDVTPQMRIRWSGRIFDVQAYENEDCLKVYHRLRLLERNAGSQ